MRFVRAAIALLLCLTLASPVSSGFLHGGSPAPLLGVYPGTSQTNITNFSTWLGKPAQGAVVFFNQASRSAFNNDVPFEISQFASYTGLIMWSFPLITITNTPAETNALAASGSYDASWTSALTQLAASRTGDAVIWLRPNWEMNGVNFWPWYCTPSPSDYISSWQHFVTIARSISSKFRFNWAVNQGQDPPAACYPGDAYVDQIGMDVYYDINFDPAGGAATFGFFKTETTGLNWMYGFAGQHAKTFSLPEWGVNTNTEGAIYINLMKTELYTQGYTSQFYFDQGTWQLSNNQYPAAGSAFIADFNH